VIDQLTLGDQLVDTIDLLATPGLFQCLSCISFDLNFEHSSSSFVKSTIAKRQFEFVVFVSNSFTIFYTVIYSQCYKIYLLCFTN